jgi:hypothetical protein
LILDHIAIAAWWYGRCAVVAGGCVIDTYVPPEFDDIVTLLFVYLVVHF